MHCLVRRQFATQVRDSFNLTYKTYNEYYNILARENLMNLDRRAHSLQNALEEARTILDQTDRARRYAMLKYFFKYFQYNNCGLCNIDEKHQQGSVYVYTIYVKVILKTKDILKYINIQRNILCITLRVFQYPLPFYE